MRYGSFKKSTEQFEIYRILARSESFGTTYILNHFYNTFSKGCGGTKEYCRRQVRKNLSSVHFLLVGIPVLSLKLVVRD